MNGPGQHSPVGASSSKRMIACANSVFLSEGIEDEESDSAALGTATHSLIEHCFKTNTDGWEHIGGHVEPSGAVVGHDSPGFPIDKKMALGAQVMLDAVRKAHPDRNQSTFFVERRFHCPTIHPLFFGTSDVIFLEITADNDLVVHVWDYKNGVILVEHVGNEQGSYYACGALEDLDLWTSASKVVIHIVQPNGFHADGPVRHWETTPDALAEWMEDVLIPAMDLAVEPAATRPTISGEHCRFCPARSHACPQLMSDMTELEALIMEAQRAGGAEALTNEQVGRMLDLLELGKIVGKAAGSTAFKRIQGGGRVPNWKLVKATGHRIFKDGAEAEAKKEFGDQAYHPAEFKSPAQIEELPLGGDFTARWATKPDNGLKLAKASDSKPEVSTDTKSLFTDVTKKSAPIAEVVAEEPAPVAVRRKKVAAAA